jgi:hypothetical protein
MMKKFYLLVLLIMVALSAGAQDRKAVGSFHAMDGYTYKNLTVDVYSDPQWIRLDTSIFLYNLRQDDWDVMLRLMRKAAHYAKIVKDNATTFDYEKFVGSFMTEDNARVVVYFITHGWEDTQVELGFYSGGRNTILTMSVKDANDMTGALSVAVNTRAEYQRQIALLID